MKKVHLDKKIKITIIFFVILMLMLIIFKIYNLTNKANIREKQVNDIFNRIETNSFVNISKYFVYGTHFNLEGNIDIISLSGIKIESVNLILKNLEGEELRFKSKL